MPAILLSDAMLRALSPGEKLIEFWDKRVPGLCLRISPGGARTWTFRYRPEDLRSFKRLGLGRYPEVGLALARARGEEKRVEVAGGADPQGERKATREVERRALTFNALADAFLEPYACVHKASWRNDELYLKVHVRPVWGEKKAKTIGRADAAALLDAIARTAPTSANRVQSVLSKLFNWSIGSAFWKSIPVAQMRKRAKEVPKDRTLSSDEICVLWRAIEEGPISESVADALKMVLLTGLRPGEIAGTALAELVDIEIDGHARLEISAARMKSRRPHITPLAPLALSIVRNWLSIAALGQEQLLLVPL